MGTQKIYSFKTYKVKAKNDSNNFNYKLNMLLLKFFLVNIISAKNIRILLNNKSEIKIVIQGSGTQNILYSSYSKTLPSEVLVNGVKDSTCKKTCNFIENKNNVTLVFESPIYSLRELFLDKKNNFFYFTKTFAILNVFYLLNIFYI